MPAGSTPSEKAFAWYDVRGAGMRLVSSALVGATLFFSLTRFGWEVRAIAAWDLFAMFLLTVNWIIITRSNADETKRRAAAEDPGRAVLSILVLFSCVAAIAAGTVMSRKAHQSPGPDSTALVALSLLAIVCAWLLTHSIYTLRYARLYYQPDDDGPGGLDFPGDEAPNDLDFAYFSFTLGMTFQTSDVEISSREIRRTVLFHSLTAFAFNTLIVANVLNALAELFKN